MKTSELRIGNFVMADTHNEVVSVNIIKSDADYNTFSPIPLTEDWLLMFGFEVKSHYAVGVGSYSTYDFGKLALLKNLKGEFYFPASPFSTVIHSVHQLQNLYFSLIGEELEIKSPNVAGNP